jgi:hypothetical protein
MSNRTAFALLLAAFALSAASPSYAQGTTSSGESQAMQGLIGGYDLDNMNRRDRVDDEVMNRLRALQKVGIDALQAKDFAGANRAFSKLLQDDPNNPDLNFLMGLAEIGLSRWEAAKGHLEVAAALKPQRPEPKTRLGLTYIDLGDIPSAQKMRAELAQLDVACKGSCDDAVWITDGLFLLDRALAAKKGNASATILPTTAISVRAAFKPTDYGAATFSSLSDVYRLITQENRCPPGYKPEREEPCALIAYTPVTDGPGVYKQYYKPVFGVVNSNTIWTMVDSRIVAVSAKTLWAPVEIENTATKGVKDKYRALAVVGSRENVDNCKQAKACLPHKELFLHYRDFKVLPSAFIDDFWGSKKMIDPGQKRYAPDTNTATTGRQ